MRNPINPYSFRPKDTELVYGQVSNNDYIFYSVKIDRCILFSGQDSYPQTTYMPPMSEAHYLRSMLQGYFILWPQEQVLWTSSYIPTVSLKERSFNVLVAPREYFIAMLNRNLDLQRYKVLYVTGNFSGILSRLHRRFTELEIRRGFTTFQLMTILEEACHSMIIEHDPMLY